MRLISVVTVLALSVVVAGCSADDGSRTTSDCSVRVRADDVVYTSYGYTEREATRHSVAARAACEDVGEDAAGSVFSERSPQVTTWSFRGYPPRKVLGVRLDADSFAVLVADSVRPAERERIVAELTPSAPSGNSRRAGSS